MKIPMKIRKQLFSRAIIIPFLLHIRGRRMSNMYRAVISLRGGVQGPYEAAHQPKPRLTHQKIHFAPPPPPIWWQNPRPRPNPLQILETP